MPDPNANWDSPSSRWGAALSWAAEPGPIKKKNMANIVLNVSKLTILEQIAKGSVIITKSTANPNVPGNTTALAALVTAQDDYAEANAAWEAYRQAGVTLLAAREAAQAGWLQALTGLAGFTELATGGDLEKITSAGFDVRSAVTPPQPVQQIMNVRVAFTGMPGHSEVTWKRDAYADAYVAQRSVDPITETSWVNVGTVTTVKYEGNGATPGQKYWYRVAGVNKLGQGPWSEPALRPVM